MVVNELSLRVGLEPRESAQERQGSLLCCPAVIREVEHAGRMYALRNRARICHEKRSDKTGKHDSAANFTETTET